MCSDVTNMTPLVATGYAFGDWIDVGQAVVAMVHPKGLATEHALSIDFRADNGDPSARVAVDLDPASARRLAEMILRTLDGGFAPASVGAETRTTNNEGGGNA